jgi:hypothetical protein
MVSERQVIAILTVVGSVAALGFALYNLYYAFTYNGTLPKNLPKKG